MTYPNKPTPLLIISDAPSASTGLGRITRDLATRLHDNCSDLYRVATFGYGGVGSCALPFHQYFMTEVKEWVLPDLPLVWQDFAGKHEPGIILTIWDASRLLWFSRPEYCRNTDIREWLDHTPVKRWGYFPVDAVGPHGGLSCMMKECMAGYDRVLAYSKWAQAMVEKSLGQADCEKKMLTAIPHGIDTSVFRPRDKSRSRAYFQEVLGYKGPRIQESETLIGIVATNQMRKDFGLAIQVVAELAKRMPVRLFIQTDTLERFWSLPALLVDYKLVGQTIVNCGEITDETMAHLYSACDVTLGIGAGEGFGYPIFESLACGTPCVTGAYGGQAEWMPQDLLITPESMRLEGLYNCFRPVYKPMQWVNVVTRVLKQPLGEVGRLMKYFPSALAWPTLWQRWQEWFEQPDRILQPQDRLRVIRSSNTPETDTDQSDLGTSQDSDPGDPASETDVPTSVEPLNEPAR